MSYNLRLPNITDGNTTEQMRQMRSYLYQTVEQLNWILNSLETTSVTVATPISNNTPTKVEKPVVDGQATFDSVKALIIKSADIINAYYDETNRRLFGEYGALSDYGEFKEQTMQEIEETSKNTTQNFTNIQQLITAIEDIEYTISEVNAYIKSGELYAGSNGVPVYGLEIGQTTSLDGTNVFTKFARFTADRLSFYDLNGSEIAYISDYKLYISNVEITNSLQIGGYVDIVTADGGVITKWVGGKG